MIHRIEVATAEGFGDPHAETVHRQIRELGIESVERVRHARLFFLAGELAGEQAAHVADHLLADPVSEGWHLAADEPDPADAAVIEVHLQPGVMDPVAASAQTAIRDMGIEIESVRTGRRYELRGELDEARRETIARRLLANPVIEDIHFARHTPPQVQGREYVLDVVEVPLRELDERGLEELSRQGHLFLSLTEMRAIQEHFRSLGREPRDVELETLAQTWSEHCVHKTFRSDVEVFDERGELLESIPNLIRSTIFSATEKLAKPWCLNVFKDNAGVIGFDDAHAVCFKVETHNHPSAIEPYGGASTGIGGVIRDPLGTGLGARPVANTDVFCFGPADWPAEDLPAGVLHPRRVMRGVVSGVRDYGNRMGIPTVNGAVYFDERYLGNPLVFCGTVGLMPRELAETGRARAGDAILVVGGRTGRDGIHGATFSSAELTHTHETEFSHAVQIGNAITEKKLVDTICQARELRLFSAITDCGAGGLSSAVGEMAEHVGAEVHLDRVPLKYQGLSYTEIWISEAQERMVLAVPAENVERALGVFAAEDVEATVIGTFGTDDRHLRLYYRDALVGEMDLEFLHDGLPRPTRRAVRVSGSRPSSPPPEREDYSQTLLRILAAPNVASKEWIVRQYDHEVQGTSVLKPLVGLADGPGDAAVVRPVLGSSRGVVISCGMNPRLGPLNAYHSALHAVDEALRNALAVGADLERTAILDNFCWGNCEKPEQMAAFVDAAKACHDAAMTYSVPFVSGKDSLNNEFRTDAGETISIPPTLLISAISVIEDVSRCVSSDAKAPGNSLFLLGRTSGELGGSHYLDAEGLESGTDVPAVDMAGNLRVFRALQAAIEEGLVRACHDLSEGGLAAAAAEMAFSGRLGVDLDLQAVPADASAGEAALLFGESAGRFLVEVAPEHYDAFCRHVQDVPFGELGRVTDDGRIRIRRAGRTRVDVSGEGALAAWRGTFTG